MNAGENRTTGMRVAHEISLNILMIAYLKIEYKDTASGKFFYKPKSVLEPGDLVATWSPLVLAHANNHVDE